MEPDGDFELDTPRWDFRKHPIQPSPVLNHPRIIVGYAPCTAPTSFSGDPTDSSYTRGLSTVRFMTTARLMEASVTPQPTHVAFCCMKSLCNMDCGRQTQVLTHPTRPGATYHPRRKTNRLIMYYVLAPGYHVAPGVDTLRGLPRLGSLPGNGADFAWPSLPSRGPAQDVKGGMGTDPSLDQ